MTITQHYTITTGADGLPIGRTTVMGVGGEVGDSAQDVTYSTNTQEFSYGGDVTGQTTITTTNTIKNMNIILVHPEEQLQGLV